MLLIFFRFITGYLKIKVNGYSPERFLNMCIHHHIDIWDLRADYQSYYMYLSVKNFRKLRPILKKTGTKIKIVEKYGLPFLFYKFRKRSVFIVGMFSSVFVLYGLNLLLWDIQIIGNQTYTEETILQYLTKQGINQTMFKKVVACEDIVDDLRANFPDITWASAHIDGVCLIIHIKENQEIIPEPDVVNGEGYDMVATSDGTISSVITRSGIPLVHEGDEVKKGDILVSGCIPITNDNDEVIRYEYVTSEADIMIDYTEQYRKEWNLATKEKVYTGLVKESFFVKYNNKIISSDTKTDTKLACEVIKKEQSLLSNKQQKYSLVIGKEIIKYYKEIDKKYTNTEVQALLSNEFSVYCGDLEEKKVEIIEKNVKISIEGNKAVTTGTLLLRSKETTLADTVHLTVPDQQEEEGIE